MTTAWRLPDVDEQIERRCRDSHKWRVVRFDYLASKITSKCAACAKEQTRFIEAVDRDRKKKRKSGKR